MPIATSERKLNLPESQLFSDLFGIMHDLESVVEFCQRLCAAYDADPRDLHLIDALSTASVVRYCRCFEMRIRAKLARECIAAVDPQFVEFHDYLFTLRQKHLVHSVNKFEDNCVTVAVAEPPASAKVLGVGIGGGRVAGLDRLTAENLKVLATKLWDATAEKFESERSRIKELVSALPIDKVYELPMVPSFRPEWKRAADKRSRHGA